ncbi:hypothetical protein GCM10009706_05240 [Curtobacterium citreum]|nr:hypothetical protein GCM10009706_05240 [Curtobacterium citreum]
MREVVDRLDAVDGGPDGDGVLQVTLRHLDVVVPGDVLEFPGGPHEHPDLVSGLEETGDESAADVPGGAGDEDVHAGHGTPVASG